MDLPVWNIVNSAVALAALAVAAYWNRRATRIAERREHRDAVRWRVERLATTRQGSDWMLTNAGNERALDVSVEHPNATIEVAHFEVFEAGEQYPVALVARPDKGVGVFTITWTHPDSGKTETWLFPRPPKEVAQE